MADTVGSTLSPAFVAPKNQEPPASPISEQDVEIEPEVETSEPPKPQGVGVFFLMLTLLGTRLGAGIVGIPYATKVVGYVFALVFQFLYLPVGMFSIWLLLQSRTMTGKASLTELGQFCYGNVSIYVINSLVALAQLGFPIIFFIVFGDVSGALIEKVNSGSSFWSSRAFTHSLLGICLIYLILQKDISKLRYAGLAILTMIILFLILFFVHFLESDPQPEDEADHVESTVNLAFMASVPTFLTTYTFQTTLFTAFATLKKKTTLNGQLADGGARIITFFVYTISPLLAFAIYGNGVEKNMLKSVSLEDGVIPTLLQFIFLIIAVMHIPIIFYIGKEAVLIMFDEATRGTYSHRAWRKQQKQAKLQAQNQAQVAPVADEEASPSMDPMNVRPEVDSSEQIVVETEQPATNMKEYLNMKPVFYYLITLTCFFIVVVLSITVEDVSVFFGIIGSLTGCFVVFIGPGSFYVISINKKNIELVGKRAKAAYILGWVYMVGGVIISTVFILCVILNAVIG